MHIQDCGIFCLSTRQMTVRGMLTAAIKHYQTRHRFLNRLDVQSQGSEAGVWQLIQTYQSQLGVILDVHVVATFESTTTFVKEVYELFFSGYFFSVFLLWIQPGCICRLSTKPGPPTTTPTFLCFVIPSPRVIGFLLSLADSEWH